jgi:DNA polymerase IV
MPRTILHADMDAFYASIEQRDDPSLRGRPLAVGGPSARGVVAAASYEARRFGVHSAMPMARALRQCPELVVVRPRIDYYAEVSAQVFAIFGSFTPLVEPLSLDEAFLDLTGCERLHGSGPEVARQIKQRVREELNLVVSVGVAPNKFLAKLASDVGKPDGLLVVEPDQIQSFLRPLPVRRLFGVGKVTEERLLELGVSTIGELADLPRELLESRLGSSGAELWQLARGDDERPVIVDRPPESIGNEDTFARDLTDAEQLGREVQAQADRVAARLREQGYQARVVVLKVKTADFKLLTRRRTLPRASSDGNLIGETARALLRKLLPGLGPVRLTGVTAGGLERTESPRQLTFDEPAQERGEELGRTLDAIASKFGEGALVRGSNLGPDRPRGRKERDDD